MLQSCCVYRPRRTWKAAAFALVFAASAARTRNAAAEPPGAAAEKTPTAAQVKPPAAAQVKPPTAAPEKTPTAAQVKPPVVLQHVDAIYPSSALTERKHTDVVLTVTVDVDGHVSKLDVDTSGGPDLDEAAVTAARQWTFEPALRNGKPVASRIKIPFHFAPPAPPPELVDTSKPDVLPEQHAIPQSTEAWESSRPKLAETATRPAGGEATTPSATTPVAAATSAPTAGTQEEVQEVDVHGHLDSRPHGTSDYQFTLDKQSYVPRANASHALELAPGFLLTNEGGSGHAEQVFLRGFDAHEGQDLEFTADGVPINEPGNYHGNGYADTHFIIPELIHSIRVLEGPYAPQQGNFAVAGSADYHLGLDKRGLTAGYTVGNFGTQRLLLLWGPGDAPPGTFAGAEYYTTDGYGANRQAKRGTVNGQWETPLAQGTLRVGAIAYFTEYGNAGVVRDDDYRLGRVDFYGTEDPDQTGNTSSRASLSIAYERRFADIDTSQQLYVIDRTLRLREDWTGFLDDVQLPTQEPHDQRGDLIDFHFDEATLGARGLARWHGVALGLRQEVEAGYFARVDHTDSTQDRVARGSDVPYLRDADYTSTLGDVGLYLDGNVHVLPWLAVHGGVRADMFLFDVLNNCAVKSVDSPSPAVAAAQIDQPCLSQLEHGAYREPVLRSATADGAVLPRGTAVVGPFDRFQFTASAGDGVRSVDPSYVSQGLLTPFVRAQSQDLGVSYAGDIAHKIGLTATSVFFRTHVDQDLIFSPTAGRNTLASGASRSGWAGSVRALGSFFDVAGNATLVKAVFDDTKLLVPYIPDLVLRGDAVIFHDLPWRVGQKPLRGTFAYGVSYVGRRPLPYGELSDITFLSDLSIGVAWSLVDVRLSAQNLFDSKYRLGEYNYASNFRTGPNPTPEPTLVPERAFTAGAPRTVFLSVSATLGGT